MTKLPAPESEKQKVTIHRQMTIEQILSLFPTKAQRLSQEITNAGLHCVGCHAATWETLEVGMLSHGKTEEEIERLLQRLNALLAEKEASRDTITITPRGAAKFLGILKEEGKEGWGLRFAVKLGGCNGYQYALDYSDKPLASEKTYQSNGIEIYVSTESIDLLIGSEIDYVDGLQGSGFKISNPNARSSCGCGQSNGL